VTSDESLVTLNCVELQPINVFGELNVEDCDATLVVGAEGEAHFIPSEYEDIRVVIHAFGDHSNSVDKADGGSEVRCWYLTNECGAIEAPQWNVRKMIVELVFAEWCWTRHCAIDQLS
jgi:hypothetical protein